MWQKDQQDRRVKSKTKLALFALLGLILLLILAKILSSFSSIGHSFNTSQNRTTSPIWDGKYSINLVFGSPSQGQQQKLSVVNLSPVDKKITILHLSDQIYTEVPRQYGYWVLGSIFSLGQEEGADKGPFLVKLSISKMLGLPVDGVVLTDGKKTPEEYISSWRSNPVSMATFLGGVRTDLSAPELINFIWQSSKIRSDKIAVLDLAQSRITQSKLLPDSSRVLGVDSIKLDSYIRDNLQDPTLRDENYSVAIFNATPHPGLAQDATRLITNLGGSVIMISNTDKYQSKSLVTIGQDLDQNTLPTNITLKRLTGFFAPSCKYQTNLTNLFIKPEFCQSDDIRVTSSRAQINIILGEDFFDYWYER